MLSAAIILIGFTSLVAQVVLMRELMVVCYGNEISLGLMLANWLLWTALGSAVFGRWMRRTRPLAVMAALECLLATAFPISIFMARSARVVWGAIPGEVLGPLPMFLISSVTLSLFCFLSGGLFPAAARLRNAGQVYLLEGIGAGIGGLLAGLVLVRFWTPFQIAALLAELNLLAAAALTRRRAMLALLLLPLLLPRLESLSLARLWHGFDLAGVRNSPYGNLAVVRNEEGASLYENGLVLSTVPDPAAAEEAVDFALLEHPAPRRVLLIGGGINGSAAEALRHPSVESLDYVELDPAIFELARAYFPREWSVLTSDRRVETHPVDGRLFLRETKRVFDVIIVNLPEPETSQLNRFYTVEFFREAARHMDAGGLLALDFSASENYISRERSDFLRAIQKTLRAVFPRVVAIPGERVHFFASGAPGALVGDAPALLARLRARHLQTAYVREYYLPFRMAPDRMRDLAEQAAPRRDTPLNRDFAPIAYYFDEVLWSTRFHWHDGAVRAAVAVCAIVVCGGIAIRARKTPRRRVCAGLCICGMGFTMVGLEMLLLLGFQAIHGYVYHQLAILTSAFMLGMALGSWSALRRPLEKLAQDGAPRAAFISGVSSSYGAARDAPLCAPKEPVRAMAFTQLAAVLAPPILVAALMLLGRGTSQAAFPMLAIGSGFLGGFQFPLAVRVFGEPGGLYALDLAGSALGAIVFSAWLIPLFGFLNTALVMTAVNVAPTWLAAASARRRPEP